MPPEELYYCPTCKKSAERVVIAINAEIELLWNDKDQVYEEVESVHHYEEIKSCLCGACLNELVNVKPKEETLYPKLEEKVNERNIIKEEKS